MGVSPISLKKNRCSKHFRPMERSAGSRRRSFANLNDGEIGEDGGESERLARTRAVRECAVGCATKDQ